MTITLGEDEMRRHSRRSVLGTAIAAGAVVVGLGARSRTAAAQSASLLIIGDTVRGELGLTMENAPFLACVQQNRFPQGSDIVFRMRALDPATGRPMDPSQISDFHVRFADGTALPLRYHPLNMGQSSDSAWIAPWPVPDDYPTGALDIAIEATDRQGRTGSYRQYDAPTSLIQIVAKGQQ